MSIAGVNSVSAAIISLDSPANISKGQTFDVGVLIDPQGAAVAGAQLDLEFNNSNLQLNSITEGNLLRQNGASTIFNSGTIDNSLGKTVDIYGAILGPTNIKLPGPFIFINATAVGSNNTIDINLINVLVVDPQGNEINLTPSSTPTEPHSDKNKSSNGHQTGGGGGGGGGGASAENYTNIELKERYDLYIYKGVTTPYCFREAGNPITCVNITGNANAGEITTTLEVLRDRSTLLDTSPDGIIYRHVNIWVGTFGFATPKNIKDATITFRVDRSWIYENGINPASITLMRYSNGWKVLPTEKTGENDAEFYYEAKTDGFAHFAITGRNSGIQVYSKVTTMSPDTGSSRPQETIPKSDEKPENEPNNEGALSAFMLVGTLLGSTYNASLIFFKMIKPGLN